MSIQDAASAIVALINSKPTSPTQAEVEAILFERWDPTEVLVLERMEPRPAAAGCISSPLAAQLLEAMTRHRAADAHQGSFCGSEPGYDAAHAEERRWKERLDELEEQIPRPPESADDIVLRAVLARYYADDDPDDETMVDLVSPDVFEWSATHLVEAILEWHGLDPTKRIALRGESTEVAP